MHVCQIQSWILYTFSVQPIPFVNLPLERHHVSEKFLIYTLSIANNPETWSINTDAPLVGEIICTADFISTT